MFIGEYHHTMDGKGRLAVPVKFRKDIAKGAVVTRGLDSCLFLYPQAEWDAMAARLAGLPIAKSNTRAFARLMLAGAMDVTIDRQGRVMIPDYLRTFAGMNRKVVIAGLYNRLEIWDEQKWNRYKASTEKNSVDIAEQLEELGV